MDMDDDQVAAVFERFKQAAQAVEVREVNDAGLMARAWGRRFADRLIAAIRDGGQPQHLLAVAVAGTKDAAGPEAFVGLLAGIQDAIATSRTAA